MARFILREPRYIRQKGQDSPNYVAADPNHPIVIELDDTWKDAKGEVHPYVPDPRLEAVAETVSSVTPEKLIPAHAEFPQGQPQVPTAAEVQGRAASKPKRTADG